MNPDRPSVFLLDSDPLGEELGNFAIVEFDDSARSDLERMADAHSTTTDQYISWLLWDGLAIDSKKKNEKGKPMVQIHPDRLNGDVIVESRSADRNHLVQLSHEQYQAASVLASQLSSSINNLLLWVHVPDSGIEMAGQDVVSTEDMTLNVDFVDGSENIRKALARQATVRNQSVEHYIRCSVLAALAHDEANSIFNPKSGAVLARRSDFGSVLKTTRNPHVTDDHEIDVRKRV
jgi:hypothetical protein